MPGRKAKVGLRGLALCLIAMPFLSGCATHDHLPLHEEVTCLCDQVPALGKRQVHVFLIQGGDLLDCSDLAHLKKHIHALGFSKVWMGQCFHAAKIRKIIREEFYDNPEAHFVLIGNGIGATIARDLAWELESEKIYFDLLVYLGGVLIDDMHRDHPPNVVKLLHIRGDGWILDGCDLSNAENVTLPVHHCKVPTHPKTLNLLATELSHVAASVPVPMPMPRLIPPQGAREILPPPGETVVPKIPGGAEILPPPKEQKDGWDFLKPRLPE